MYAEIMKLSKKTIKRFLSIFGLYQKELYINKINKIYEEKEYIEAYSQNTDIRVEKDPKQAVGGKWEEIGQLQFKFLINNNLQPDHTMLDLGCGTLRGGRHFINYLNTGNYYGIDISSKAIAYAKKLIQKEGLSEKSPHLLVSENKNLKFMEFSDKKFDYILAQSVFTHLKPEHIKECFENIGNIMLDHSAFYFTYSKGEKYEALGRQDFQYPFSFFESLAEQYKFKLQDCSKEYKHPRNQIMVKLMKK